MTSPLTLFTVGHSNHSPAHFQALLEEYRVDVLVDIRSWPHSRYVDWADRSHLPDVARAAHSKYLFLGSTLGGRPDGSEFYDESGHALYWRVARTKEFRADIDRLQRGIEACRVVIMCSEESPATCHRRLLVSKVLLDRGIVVTHIRGNGESEVETDPIRFAAGALFGDEESLWKSSRSVLRNRQLSTSFDA